MLQESYLKVLDGRARFNGRASARTWFFSVIKRTASEIARKGVRRNALDQTLEHSGAADPERPDDLMERSDETQQLLAALNQLPDRQREVLHLVFYHDATLEEAATALGISVGAVRTHYHRGKQKLAQLLHMEPADVD